MSRIRLLSLADVPGTFLIQFKIHIFGTSSKNVGKVFMIHILSLADVQDGSIGIAPTGWNIFSSPCLGL